MIFELKKSSNILNELLTFPKIFYWNKIVLLPLDKLEYVDMKMEK